MSDYEPGYDDAGEYDDAPAQSSIAAPLIRALLAAAVAFGIYALVFGDIGGGDDLDVVATDGDQAAGTAPAAAPQPDASTVPLQPLPNGSASPEPTASGSEGDGSQVGVGVSVQVIAGAGTTQDQFADAVDALAAQGYDVTESGISPNDYPETTIFASPGQESQATALNTADPRFTTIGENPGTLTEEIQIHVLVGEDWPIADGAAPTDGATDAATEGATDTATEG